MNAIVGGPRRSDLEVGTRGGERAELARLRPAFHVNHVVPSVRNRRPPRRSEEARADRGRGGRKTARGPMRIRVRVGVSEREIPHSAAELGMEGDAGVEPGEECSRVKKAEKRRGRCSRECSVG